MGMRLARSVIGARVEQPEDADHALAAPERDGADLDGHAGAARRDEDTRRIRGRGGAEHLLSEQFAGPPPVLRRDDTRELAAANVAYEPFGSRIDPPNDPGIVQDVARDPDAVQCLFDVSADSQAGGHHASVPDRPLAADSRAGRCCQPQALETATAR